jgi:hypothetical protein
MMRHSDIRITMKLYADVTGLPLNEAATALPLFGVGCCVSNFSGSNQLRMGSLSGMSARAF